MAASHQSAFPKLNLVVLTTAIHDPVNIIVNMFRVHRSPNRNSFARQENKNLFRSHQIDATYDNVSIKL